MGILKIEVPKSGGQTLDVETDDLNAEVYAAIMTAGLEALLGKRMSKITGLTKMSGDDLTKAHDAAIKIATENLDALKAGKVSTKRTKAKADGVSREVKTEATRLAKAVVKDQIRAAGMKISTVAAKDITAAANELIANDPSYIETAKVNIEARAAKPLPNGFDIKAMIHESPKLVEAAAKKAAANKADGLSAKQAGKVKPAKKGSKPTEVPATETPSA